MRLVRAHVQNFKSIADSGVVSVDSAVTVFVGQNEAGKTAFLQALHKASPADGDAAYDLTMEYPRRHLNDYEERHQGTPAPVAILTYEITPEEITAINEAYGCAVVTKPELTVTHRYAADSLVEFNVDEAAFLQHVVQGRDLPSDVVVAVTGATSVPAALASLKASDRNTETEIFYQELEGRFGSTKSSWPLLDFEVWSKHISSHIPKFVYFDEYRFLPGRTNLTALNQRVTSTPSGATDEDRAVLGLLRMAKVELKDLLAATSYEHIKAKLEAFSNSVTDRVFKYWKQSGELDVEIDVRTVPNEPAPYNNGPNLYIRIKHRRHRSTVSFDQRSRGFIWFFSFLVWFDSVKQQLGTDRDLILLLDEPGLSLHALAQADFLDYIDDLAKKHQTLYTTHSPFMVRSDRLNQVRLVEDRKDLGTTVTDDVTGSDPKTVFPLQAALGYTIAQNLFISKRNLLVEGPADLIYLQQMTSALEQLGRTGLRPDVTIVPTGGLDNVATFVALLGGNSLEVVVLHDRGAQPHQRLEHLKREKIIRERHVLDYGAFRSETAPLPKKGKAAAVEGAAAPPTDVEDLIALAEYLELFNAAFAVALSATVVTEADLPPGDRVVERITRYLTEANLQLRLSGGFNHYTVASYLAAHPPEAFDAGTLDRFERVFKAANALFSPADV